MKETPLYEPDTWEHAVANIIVFHEMEHEFTGKAKYRDLFRSEMFVQLARVAWTELVRNGDEWDLHDQVALLASKQHDYGAGNILEFGAVGIKVRLFDKIARYENLHRRGADPANESLQDTLRDMIGYCILGQMLQNNTFILPLAADKDR